MTAIRFIILALLICCFIPIPALGENTLPTVGEPETVPGDPQRSDTGAIMRAGGGQGGTDMHWMAFNGDEAGVSQLIISGAEVNSRLKTGGTPLHLAAYRGHANVVRLLLEHGAKANARTKAGVTPLDWAQRNGHKEVARLLIAYGGKSGKRKETDSSSLNTPDAKGEVAVGAKNAALAPKKFSLMGLPPEGSVVVLKEPLPADEAVAEKAVQQPPATKGYRIQLGAFSSQQGAIDAWAHFQKQFPRQLGERELLIDRLEAREKTFYRVQTGPLSRPNAWEICGELKQAGQSCAVMKRTKP